MNRRFVNLVTASYDSRMYSLRRLDVAKHLFYPSTAAAEAANEKENNNGGKPPRIEKLRRLPEPSLRLQSCLDKGQRWPCADAFSLVSPDGGGRILHTNGGRNAILCDVQSSACSTVRTLPRLAEPKGHCPHPVTFAVAGEESLCLYVLRSALYSSAFNFEVILLGGGGGGEEEESLPFDSHGGPDPEFRWHPLPPPPIGAGDVGGGHPKIMSSTLLDNGNVICVSTRPRGDSGTTYCFDTERREWRRAGDWPLPFDGRAVHVPELDTWVGFSPTHPHHLCAGDLSAVAAMEAPTTTTTSSQELAPTLAHVWEDFNAPPEERKSIPLNRRYPHVFHHHTRGWVAMERHLVSLGSGRFCVARTFTVEETDLITCSVANEPWSETVGELAVLTGVEVVRAGEGGHLRMVKHKSKRYMFSDDCVIKWVL